jgi:hypothetical protein
MTAPQNGSVTYALVLGGGGAVGVSRAPMDAVRYAAQGCAVRASAPAPRSMRHASTRKHGEDRVHRVVGPVG